MPHTTEFITAKTAQATKDVSIHAQTKVTIPHTNEIDAAINNSLFVLNKSVRPFIIRYLRQSREPPFGAFTPERKPRKRANLGIIFQ